MGRLLGGGVTDKSQSHPSIRGRWTRAAGITTVIADPLPRGLIPGVRQFTHLHNALQSRQEALIRDLA
jgi:hypothetical protein